MGPPASPLLPSYSTLGREKREEKGSEGAWVYWGEKERGREGRNTGVGEPAMGE